MKKLVAFFALTVLVLTAGCRTTQPSPYNRSGDDDYERYLSKHVFAACQNIEQPYALYSLANLLKRPSNNDPHYKVQFVNGPCKGQAVWTTQVILKTEPVTKGELLPRGTALLRNYWNPKEVDTAKTDRWNVGIVSSTSRMNKGIIDLAFPRDNVDFSAAREGIYLHNVRRIVTPEVKDIRIFLH